MAETVIPAEYPFINVHIDTSGLQPLATRANGNVVVVGSAGGFGKAKANVPVEIGGESDARDAFANTNALGGITGSGPLYKSLVTLLAQQPAPSRVYAVATSGTAEADYETALHVSSSLPVQFVGLANEVDPAKLAVLAKHVTDESAGGNTMMGVAMVNPDLNVPDGSTLAKEATTAYAAAKTDDSRMILVAARVTTTGGAPDTDVAAAAMGTIAGYAPHISILMKQVRQVKIPLERQFRPTEIKQLAEAYIVPLIDSELIPGEGLFMGSGRAFTTDTTKLYPDIVRTMDQIDFMLKAGLIGSIGNVRIDRLGMQALKSRFDGILQPLVASRVIVSYDVNIPLLAILQAEESARTPGQKADVTTARTSRVVNVILSVTYSGSVHFLNVNLALTA